MVRAAAAVFHALHAVDGQVRGVPIRERDRMRVRVVQCDHRPLVDQTLPPKDALHQKRKTKYHIPSTAIHHMGAIQSR